MSVFTVQSVETQSQYQPKYYPNSLDIAQDDPNWNSFHMVPNRLIRVVGCEEAIFVTRLHYWLQKPDLGVWKHGYHWIYNTAWMWQEQFPWLSEYMVGQYRRSLEKRGWVVSNNFNQNPTNRTKYSTLDYWLIAQETGWNPLNIDLNQPHQPPPEFKKGQHLRKRHISDNVPDVYSYREDFYVDPLSDPESPEAIYDDAMFANSHYANSTTSKVQNGENPTRSISKDFQEITKNFSKSEKEKFFAVLENLLGLAKEEDTHPSRNVKPNVKDEARNCKKYSQGKNVIDREKNSGAAAEHLNNDSDVVSNEDYHATNGEQRAKPIGPNKHLEKAKKKGRQQSHEPPQREKYEWEIAVGEPYPDFIWWRANRHYKPQGSHWADGAYSNAAAEIINKGVNARFLWQDFLREANKIADNGLLMIANNREPYIPKNYRQKPLDAKEVGGKLNEVKEFVEQGKYPESLQAASMPQSLTESPAEKETSSQIVKAAEPSNEAEEEVKYVEVGDKGGQQVLLQDYTGFAEKQASKYSPLTLEQKVRNWQIMWKTPATRKAIANWVKATEGVILTEDGPVLVEEAEPGEPVAPTVPTFDAYTDPDLLF